MEEVVIHNKTYEEKVNFLMNISRIAILGTNGDDEMPKSIGLARYTSRQAARNGYNDECLYEFVVFEILSEWLYKHLDSEFVEKEFIERELGNVLKGTDEYAVHRVIHSHYGGWVLGDATPQGMENLFSYLCGFVAEFQNDDLPVLSLSDDYDSDADPRYD
jgi:hypothetical protein